MYKNPQLEEYYRKCHTTKEFKEKWICNLKEKKIITLVQNEVDYKVTNEKTIATTQVKNEESLDEDSSGRSVDNVDKGFGFKDFMEVESWWQKDVRSKTEESRTTCRFLEKTMIVV